MRQPILAAAAFSGGSLFQEYSEINRPAVKITLIAHSTTLIEAAGRKILTDPYFGLHGNPAYARVDPPSQPRDHGTCKFSCDEEALAGISPMGAGS